MNGLMIGLLAETSIHAGSGQTAGVVDLPVAREAVTDYPVIVGSSLKGALRDKAEQQKMESKDEVFGMPDFAGAVAVTDGRLLLLPVRSLTGHFRWVTCPYILRRWQRDIQMMGSSSRFFIPDPQDDEAYVAIEEESLFLEEFSFRAIQKKSEIQAIASELGKLIQHESVRDNLVQSLTIVHDDMFRYFAKYGLSVQARNQLDAETKESKNLWYEETLPPDTLLYTLILPRLNEKEQLARIKKMFAHDLYVRVGGNETIGQGWCITSIMEGGSEHEVE
ncbi:type III-B CRISPR module RAMP protein Cmr4 [Rubeoparvulum massiliense]|uniref:type III-B CRISPR module RAMP protein Cmr4 n=1 Tax=Rubeoparvulum massiliense TaxID=1631346 RepID=UPI00065E96E6|nr:type III-B CRISPR module RAMP protein Cmr4 [Rubeoparvulum massiliense]